MRTLGDIIVVERDPVPDKFEGTSIIKPESVIEAEKNEWETGVIFGTVKVVGPECKKLQPGHRIMFHKSTCAEMEHEGKPFRALHEHEVLAIVEDDGHIPN